MNINFITFSTSNWVNSKIRYNEQLSYIKKNYDFLNCYKILSEKDLPDSYYNDFKHKKKANYNGGFYLKSWKPFIILNELYSIKDNDFVIYMDGGCSLFNYKQFQNDIELIQKKCNDMVNEYIYISMPYHNNLPVKIQIRKEILEKFDLLNDDFFLNKSFHYGTGCMIIRKCQESIKLMNDWYNYYINNYETVNFKRFDKTNQEEYFRISNRDQPILQCLIYKNNINVLGWNESLKFVKRIRN